VGRRFGGRLRLVLIGVAVASVLAAPGSYAQGSLVGVDVSSYQHPDGAVIDWSAVAGHGASFAIVKATEGSGYVNPYFASDWVGIARAHLVRGAYEFARPAWPLSTAVSQAEAFVSTTGTTRELGDLPPALDLEDSGGLSAGQLVAWAHRWLDTVQQLTGRLPMIYTYPRFWQWATGDDASFGAYPLWEAAYSGTAPSPLPGWSRWTLWQHSDGAGYPGIADPVDESVFCCAVGMLAGLADGRTPAIARLWAQLGGASGVLGLPTGPETAVAGGWAQTYEHGLIGWTARVGAHVVMDPIWSRYTADGGPTRELGLPVTDATPGGPGVLTQAFAGGEITWSAATGAHGLTGGFLRRWTRDGGLRAAAGLPTQEALSRTGGASQQLQGAGLYQVGGTVYEVPGPIRDRYEQLGGPDSPLGMPAGDAFPVLGGQQVDFHTGSLREIVTSAGTFVL